MIGRRIRGSVAVGALAAAIATAPFAAAQYTKDPFFESTLQLSQAIGFELALQRLRIVEAIDAPYEAEFAEIVENLTGPDFERFGGTLADLDQALADRLFDVLDAFAEAVEDGEADEVEELLPTANSLLNEAYDLVIPPDVREDHAFKGAVMAQLFLGEGGVAEGLEEAFEEEWEFANGWGATQRVNVLWSEIRDAATPQQQADIEEMLAAIDAIYPSPEPPESLAGIDPEEAETPAQRIVGFLEVVVDAQLYSGRDQVRLLNHLGVTAAAGCAYYDAGDDQLGREVMYAVFDHYAGETTGLGALIGLFAPEVHEEAMEAFEHLVTIEDDDDDGDAAVDPSGDELDDDEAMTAAAACEAVVEALDEGRAILGG